MGIVVWLGFTVLAVVGAVTVAMIIDVVEDRRRERTVSNDLDVLFGLKADPSSLSPDIPRVPTPPDPDLGLLEGDDDAR